MNTTLRRALSLVGLVLALLHTGCATQPVPSAVDWKRFEPMFEVAAYTGAKIYLVEHPEQRQLFVTTVDLLDALVADPQLNASKFAVALQDLPIKELQDPKAAIIIGSSLVLWSAYKDRLPLGEEGAAVLRPIAVRVRNGLGAALGLDLIVPPGQDMLVRLALSDNQLMQLKR